jgi:hypothetical protein
MKNIHGTSPPELMIALNAPDNDAALTGDNVKDDTAEVNP